jgi:hypothetical protein
MDPVNKWLTVVILFMASMVFALWNISGSGRYTMVVETSTLLKNHAVVYVLDTKDGNVSATLVAEDDMMADKTSIKRRPQQVFVTKEPSYNRRY